MTQPWSAIKQRYESVDTAPSRAMLELVAAIEKSRYATGLHAWTSMFDLCITQTPVDYPYDGPLLRIAPSSGGAIEFRYIDTPIKEKQWHRTVEAKHAFRQFESFLEQLHWFIPQAAASDS